MTESLSAVTSLVPSLSSQIVTILVKRSVEPLKLVRSVASQVRASTRKGPLEPSYFVHSILKELGAYLAGPGRVVEDELRVKWATAVVDDIAGRCVLSVPLPSACIGLLLNRSCVPQLRGYPVDAEEDGRLSAVAQKGAPGPVVLWPRDVDRARRRLDRRRPRQAADAARRRGARRGRKGARRRRRCERGVPGAEEGYDERGKGGRGEEVELESVPSWIGSWSHHFCAMLYFAADLSACEERGE